MAPYCGLSVRYSRMMFRKQNIEQIHRRAHSSYCSVYVVQILLIFKNKVELIQTSFNCFPLEKHCILTGCVHMQCQLLTSTHGSGNVVHTKYLGSLLWRTNFAMPSRVLFRSSNLCSIYTRSTAKFKSTIMNFASPVESYLHIYELQFVQHIYTQYGKVQINTPFEHSRILMRAMHPQEMLATLQK